MELQYGAQTLERRDDPTIRAFRHDRFGQFIHWGLYALPAGAWNGTTYDFAAEFLPKSARIDDADWQAIAADFTVEHFDAKAWARTAKAMGARYVTVTAKHHDGFCLWPSAFSDTTVAATPHGRDLLGEIVEAYEEEGLAVHLYYSVLDWHHPDWRYRIDSPDDEIAFARFLEFAQNQLRELATRYPTVRGFWFDGTWDESVKANGWWTLEVERMLKQLIPGVMVNSRLRADEHGARHHDSNGDMMGDFFSGYERRLPDAWDRSVAAHDWEACMTIPQGSWGYHEGAAAAASRKKPSELIEQLAHIVSLDGNLLLNFGPMGDGALPGFEVETAAAIGDWMEVNGAAIHGCGMARDWDYPGWGHYTHNAETGVTYAIVTRIPVTGVIKPVLPVGTRLRSVTALATSAPVEARLLDERTISVDVPRESSVPLVYAIEVERDETQRQTVEVNPDVAEAPAAAKTASVKL
ncbi:alpha-L-fucosidase [Planctomonas sp. JC2975]|uniref:alpha-L-fucosidase n=1 Tax=Planctomonas sp. JC2975 TaxID=2729626 RepID=UPI001473D832|nr:alpha-L-fucosidase [Planctomonas sp. JC2975]NNC12428.1 alpha-L-fucosidase [Planctomonas sp. JC2975]